MSLSQSELRARHYAYYRAKLPGMIAHLDWDRSAIDAARDAALRAMLRHVKALSPWHAARLAAVDPDAAELRLGDVPVMRKADLMANWDAIVTVPGATRALAEQHVKTARDQQYLFGDHVLMTSGGTGGSPGLYLYDWNGFAVNFASLIRSIMVAAEQEFGVGQTYRIGTIGVGASLHGSYVMGRIFSDPENTTRAFSVWDSQEILFPALSEFAPEFIFATASYALTLVAGQREGRLNISPRVFFFGSEHLSPAAQAAVRATWPQARVFTSWGTTEGAGTFACPTGEGFHVSEDCVIIEPIDAQGQPCPPGALSHSILLTNLYNTALPLLRYQIDDVFDFDSEPCACGSAYRKISQVHGRAAERFHYGAVSIYGTAMEVAVLEQPDIQEYQLVQLPAGVLIRYAAAAPADEARMHERILHNLIRSGLAAPEVRIERVGAVERSKVGKIQRFVPLPG